MARRKKNTEGETTQEVITNSPESEHPDVENTEGETDAPVFRVISEFRDAENFNKKWKPGEDVSHFEESRLSHLIEIGCVKKEI